MSKETFDFSEALRRIKEGKKVRRIGWGIVDKLWIDKDKNINIFYKATTHSSEGFIHIFSKLLEFFHLRRYSCNRLGGGGRMKKKILTLTVSKQWFDMIADGRKDEEYRTIKGYWVKRLFLLWNEDTCTNEKIPTHCVKNWDSISPEMANYCINSPYYKAIPYTHVLFINGYRKDSPRIEKEIESITIGKPKKGLCPDKWLDTEFFIIKFK